MKQTGTCMWMLIRGKANICTKYNNEFDGEPDMPVSEDIQIEFIPCRDTWD